MRKISRYTKLLIVSTLLTASFGLTTEAVRSQETQGYSGSITRRASSSDNAVYYEVQGDAYWNKGLELENYGQIRDAADFFNKAADNYTKCYGVTGDRNVYSKWMAASAEARRLLFGY